ncbi:YbaK/EbsC family protein [Oceanicella sp. SM1341]|uniref:YbaK/EbsC family protein n=1 Tax=Oceanicella sp. SM1341 TaxID=1548889 RepID=UPI000E556E3A|nr:YbaK/EbsC family protein [Oceanicella sp. SM1341]
MAAATPGTRALRAAGVDFELHPYPYDAAAARTGLQAAEALGIAPGLVLKTLMLEADGRPACAVIPSDRELSMKRAAAAFGARQAGMMPVPKAERLTGYHVGGISPFGQKRRIPVAFEETVLGADRVWINAGQRGLLLSLAPAAALAALGAVGAVGAPLVAQAGRDHPE